MRLLSISTVISLFAIGLSLGATAACAEVACPPTISVEQKATAPNQWSVDYSKMPAALSSATIFDGAPEARASLKYDDERSTKNETVLTWELPASDRGYWLVCGYTNTTAQLRRELPGDFRRCEVVLEKGSSFGDGSAVVKRARCSPAATSR